MTPGEWRAAVWAEMLRDYADGERNREMPGIARELALAREFGVELNSGKVDALNARQRALFALLWERAGLEEPSEDVLARLVAALEELELRFAPRITRW